jgi:hypothetical protein
MWALLMKVLPWSGSLQAPQATTHHVSCNGYLTQSETPAGFPLDNAMLGWYKVCSATPTNVPVIAWAGVRC